MIETKLFKNSDKRQVIAQVLDYGASLWSTYKDPLAFFNSLEESAVEEFGTGLQQKAKDFFKLDEDEWIILFENLKDNIHGGKFRFVVLMDRLHSQLKDLILFINSNSNFDVFAVEIEYYKHEDFEIIIPKLFGEEAKPPSNGSRDRWTKVKFLDEANKRMNEKAFSMLRSLLEFTEQYASKLDWGTGKESGSFTFKMDCAESDSGRISLFTIWTKGKVRFRFRNILNHAGIRFAESYFQKLSSFPFARNWNKADVVGQSPGSDIEEAFPEAKTFEKFKSTIREFVNECATKTK